MGAWYLGILLSNQMFVLINLFVSVKHLSLSSLYRSRSSANTARDDNEGVECVTVSLLRTSSLMHPRA